MLIASQHLCTHPTDIIHLSHSLAPWADIGIDTLRNKAFGIANQAKFVS